MASKEQIRKVILDLAGNPSSGSIKNLADSWANAIVALDSKVPDQAAVTVDDTNDAGNKASSFGGPEKETRVTKPVEKR